MKKVQVLTAEELGFTRLTGRADAEAPAWRKHVRGQELTFRFLRRVQDLVPVEELQRETFGATDLDILAASEMVAIPETGGEVIGAFAAGPDGGETLVAVSIGWGGFHDRRPRLVSDFLAVRKELRSAGIGTELKKLQATIAIKRGFEEIVWTVEPLRAANARVNFEKLGAYADRYEENRYGAGFGAGLYGSMPTDRLHVTWPITTARVRDCLLGRVPPRTAVDVAGLGPFDPASPADRTLVYLPTDIDRLLADNSEEALRWRMRLRETLPRVFAAGFAIVGFVPDVDTGKGLAAYVIDRGHVRHIK